MLVYSLFGTIRWDGGIFQAGIEYMQNQLTLNSSGSGLNAGLNGGINNGGPGSGFLRSIIATGAFVFVSYGGLLNVSTMAEEVKKPGKNIPRAILASVAVITFLYVAMVAVTSAVLPPELFSGSLTPIADGAFAMLGSAGLYVIAVASSLAFITTGNAGLMSASRYPLAMSRDGLLPRGISGENQKGIPVPALCTTAIFIGLSILIPLEALVKLASTVILISYMAVNIAVLVLRESGVRNYRPLFSLPGYPLVPVLSLVFMAIFLVELGISSVEILLLFAGGGLLIYLLYGKRQNSYEYAALHLVKNAVDNRLQNEGLETELRSILRNREQLSQDLTDRLLAEALTVDIDYRESVHGAFQMAGSRLAPKTGMTSEEITRLLEERESRFTTALTDFVSIPHILIPGRDEIHLVLLRDREGLYFDDSHPSIHAMFIIVGSEDRRDDHLKLIAGLAHVIQHKNFQDIWLSAESMNDLKDQLILLDRKRVE
jgi:mannitol/fructose-specific phosphotransferase system IIA component (Ntr-type)